MLNKIKHVWEKLEKLKDAGRPRAKTQRCRAASDGSPKKMIIRKKITVPHVHKIQNAICKAQKSDSSARTLSPVAAHDRA